MTLGGGGGGPWPSQSFKGSYSTDELMPTLITYNITLTLI